MSGTLKRIERNRVMKPNMKPTKKNGEDMTAGAPEVTLRTGESQTLSKSKVPKNYRRLKWDEVVRAGDVVANEQGGFEPWEGLNGFRADAFVNIIYRATKNQPGATTKLK